jgi:hypothetical protein
VSIRVGGKYSFARSPSIKLFDQTLTATGRFDVTGIPPGYGTLQGRLLARSDVVDTFDFSVTFFNGDTTAANYRRASHEGGTSHVSAVADDSISGILTGANSPANYFGYVDFSIPSYTGSHEKIMSVISGARRTATIITAYQFFIHWENVSAINQITLQPDGFATDEFVANSRLQLWGIY